MNMQEDIKQTSLSFIDLRYNSKKDNIWTELSAGLWKDFNIDTYLSNNLLLPNQKHMSKPVFTNLLQIESGVKYDENAKRCVLDTYAPKFIETSFDKFLELAENFFKSLNAKRIGVHLSGGLDSGLIIGLLHYLNIPFVPIGLYSDTFEFRTERTIQEKLINWGEDGLMLSMEDYPFYSNLLNIPKHQIPCGIFKGYVGSHALAKAFRDRGCDVVLSGQGGDSLFVEGITDLNNLSFNIGDEFENGEESDLIYKPLDIRLISFYSNTDIIDFISSARVGQNDDTLKLWARKWLKNILIPELSQYAYFADFFGLTLWGLNQSLPQIADLFEETYFLTKSPIFSPRNVKRYLHQDLFSFEHKEYISFCSLISVAVWYHSLMQ